MSDNLVKMTTLIPTWNQAMKKIKEIERQTKKDKLSHSETILEELDEDRTVSRLVPDRPKFKLTWIYRK